MAKGFKIAPEKKAAALAAIVAGTPDVAVARKYRVKVLTVRKWMRSSVKKGDAETARRARDPNRKGKDVNPLADALVHLKRARALATKADFGSEAFLNCMLALTRLERGR